MSRYLKMSRGFSMFALITAVMCAPVSYAASMSGMVSDSAGRPVAGAFIKVRDKDSRILFMVISRSDGRYSTPNLPAGTYTVQGLGGDRQGIPSAPIKVNETNVNVDVSLDIPRKLYTPPRQDYTEEEFAEMMPAGAGRELLLTKCTICHSAGNFVSRRKTAADWHDTVVKMRYRWEQLPMMVEAYTTRTGKSVEPITDSDIAVMSDYLAKNYDLDTPPLFGPPHPDSHLPAELDGTNYVVMEINLGDALVGSYDIDPGGTIWVSEKTSGILGRFDQTDLSYERVYTPPVNVEEEFFGGVAVDPRGMIWFSSNVVPDAKWYQYDPVKGKVINTYDVTLPSRPGGDIFFNSFAFPEGGTVWSVVTAFHKIIKLNPVTREVREFPLREGAHPFGMTIGGDGNVWIAGDNDNLLLQFDPDSDVMAPVSLNPNTGPRRLATDAQGNIWAAGIDRNVLVRFDYRTGNVTEYYPPAARTIQGVQVEKYLQGVDVDKRRNHVWFSEYHAIRLGRLDPATETFLELPLATAESQPWIVKLDPLNPDRVWWNARNGRLGYLELMK